MSALILRTPPPGYDSWLDFWEKKKGKKVYLCKAYNCRNDVKVGGHDYKVGVGGKEYILPLCSPCNNKDESFYASEDDLVPVTG